MNNDSVEQEIQDKKLTAPRITREMIEMQIVNQQYHVFEGSQLTVCCLTLKNGFTVIGTSACVSPENYDKVIGNTIAKAKAFDEIWVLEGYLLKQAEFELKGTKVKTENDLNFTT